MDHTRRLRPICAAIALILLLSIPAFAKEQVFLVVADRLTLSDLTKNAPANISRLVRRSAIGLINPASAGRRTPEGAYVAMGAGSGLMGSPDVYEGYDWSEMTEDAPASIVYQRRTGRVAPVGSVVNVAAGSLASLNEAKRLPGFPGALGEALKLNGNRVAVFGNSDLPDKKRRPVVTFAMDAQGIVPEGVVSSWILKSRPLSPTGKVTDVPLLLRLAGSAAARSSLIVIDFGDTSRLEEYAPRLSPQARSRYLRDSIGRLDQLIGGLLDMADASGSFILLVSPLSREEDGALDRLSPVLVYHGAPSNLQGNVPENPFLISSATTRTPGLVSVVDVAPTVASILRAPFPARSLGKPFQTVKPADRMAQMRRLDNIVRLQARAEWPVLGVMATIIALAVTSSSLILAFRVRTPAWLRAALRALIAFVLVFPLALLIGSLYNGSNVITYGIFVAVAAAASLAAISLMAALVGDCNGDCPISALPAVIALVTVGVLVVDSFAGGRLAAYSLIGAFQLTGLRFYGIGNELMGVLIGSALVAALWLRQKLPSGALDRRYRALFALGLIVVLLVIALPDLGANVGGAIAAVIAFGLCFQAAAGKRITFALVAVLFAVAGAVVGALALFDLLLRPESGSHAGLTAKMIGQGGWKYLGATIGRKLGFNLQLLGTRQGQTALLGFTPFFMLWFAGVQRRVNERLEGRPEMANGLIAVVIGAVVALLFNDSGAVAASLLLCVPALALLYSLMEEEGRVTT